VPRPTEATCPGRGATAEDTTVRPRGPPADARAARLHSVAVCTSQDRYQFFSLAKSTGRCHPSDQSRRPEEPSRAPWVHFAVARGVVRRQLHPTPAFASARRTSAVNVSDPFRFCFACRHGRCYTGVRRGMGWVQSNPQEIRCGSQLPAPHSQHSQGDPVPSTCANEPWESAHPVRRCSGGPRRGLARLSKRAAGGFRGATLLLGRVQPVAASGALERKPGTRPAVCCMRRRSGRRQSLRGGAGMRG